MFSAVMSSDLRRELLDVIRAKVHDLEYAAVKGNDPEYEHQEESQSTRDAAVILLSACLIGTDPVILADFTQLDPEFVKKTAERFEKAGTWARASSECGWFEDGGLPFWLEVYEGCESL